MTISPSPEAISLGSSALVTRRVPSTLVSHIQRQFVEVGVGDRLAAPLAPPALLTSTSTRSRPAASASTAAPSVTSATIAVPPISVGEGLDAVLAAGHADHVKAKSGKGFRGRLTDAGAGTGDDRDALRGFECRHSSNFSWRAKFATCPPVRLPASPHRVRVVVVAHLRRA